MNFCVLLVALASLTQHGYSEKLFGCEVNKHDKIFFRPGLETAAQINSVDECVNACLLRPKCQSITFLRDNNICYYHTAKVTNLTAQLENDEAVEGDQYMHVDIVSCPEDAVSSPSGSIGCGKQATKHRPSLTRIIGGNVAQEHSWPWQVYVEVNVQNGYMLTTFSCGGSLLRVKDKVEKSDIVLTAAHCVTRTQRGKPEDIQYPPEFVKVIAGTHDKGTYKPGVQVRGVDTILSHPDLERILIHNDIALIKLSEPIKFTDKIRPICLPTQGEALPIGKECAVAGWGRISPTTEETSPVLKQLGMQIHNASVCKNGWPQRPEWKDWAYYVEDMMVCGGDLSGKEGTCKGDSGGMLACKQNGTYTLYGATSFGAPTVCVQANIPKVFARVSNYVKWIKDNTSKMSSL